MLRIFGFGPNFVKWVEILLKKFNMRVVNGGIAGTEFKSESGARQDANKENPGAGQV